MVEPWVPVVPAVGDTVGGGAVASAGDLVPLVANECCVDALGVFFCWDGNAAGFHKSGNALPRLVQKKQTTDSTDSNKKLKKQPIA